MKRTLRLSYKSKALPIFLLIVSSITNQHAFAGSTSIGTINYSIPGAAGATAVPSLSGTMLIVLSLLLFIVAFRVSKQKTSKNKEFFVSLIGVLALSSSIGGFKIISDVNAGAIQALTLTLTSETTGSAPIFGGFNFYDNSFGVEATITSINIPNNFNCTVIALAKEANLSAPLCEVDNVIPNGAQCQLNCSNFGSEVSDLRLKNSINPLTKLDNDIQLYSFKYNGNDADTFVGVMAQDLIEDRRYQNAVRKMDNDYYVVNYNHLGLKMISYKEWQKSPNSIFKDKQ